MSLIAKRTESEGEVNNTGRLKDCRNVAWGDSRKRENATLSVGEVGGSGTGLSEGKAVSAIGVVSLLVVLVVVREVGEKAAVDFEGVGDSVGNVVGDCEGKGVGEGVGDSVGD